MGTSNYDFTYLEPTSDIDLVGDTTEFLDEIDNAMLTNDIAYIKCEKLMDYPSDNPDYYFNGMATDGSNLYIANSANGQNTIIIKVDIASGSVIGTYDVGDLGHANSMSYYNGFLYVVANTSYRGNWVYMIDAETLASGTVSVSHFTLPTNCFAYARSTSSNRTFDCYGISGSSEYVISSALDGKMIPYKTFYGMDNNNVKQGMDMNAQYIFQALHKQGKTKPCVQVYTLKGTPIKTIYFDIPYDEELEDVCMGENSNVLYLNTVSDNSDGHVYVADATQFLYYSGTTDVAFSWCPAGTVQAYANENGSEVYIDKVAGDKMVLKSFKVNPLYDSGKVNTVIARAMIDGVPATADLVLNSDRLEFHTQYIGGTGEIDSYYVSYAFDSATMTYNLDNIRIVKQPLNGTAVVYNGNAANNWQPALQYLTNNVYVSTITAMYGIPYWVGVH